MALGPGLPTRMVCPSPFWRTASAVPMVPPPPDRFSTIADWPHAVCRCAASNRPITSVVPPAAAGTMRRTFSVGRQSAAWPRRGKAAVADSAAAADSTRRRESSLVTFHSLLGFSFAGERRECAGGRQADGLAQVPGLEHDPEKACPRATTRWVGCRAGRWASCKLRDDGIVPLICPTCQNVFAGFAQSIHASDRHATLHGVVFDILVGSQSRVGPCGCLSRHEHVEVHPVDPLDRQPDMTADDLGHALCYHLLGSGRAGFASRRRLDRSSVLETGLTRARHEPAIGATKSTRLVGLRRSLARS